MSIDSGSLNNNDTNTEGVNEESVADNDVLSALLRIEKLLKILVAYKIDAMDYEITKDDIE